MKKKFLIFILLLTFLLGVIGITEGAMTYTSRSEFCVSCHVMEGQYERWQNSSHIQWAGCSDCHVPHDNYVNMMMTKALDGMGHVYAFTIEGKLEDIKIKERSAKVVNDNCLRCHEDLMQGINTEGRNCWDCHRGLPHGF
ncbi:MAG: cytochrome c nitrite reductase small subunit [Clostridia bacterium]|nr:cytochrome c nitrite reductase small subunit [Clostridia bacterium]